MKYSIITYGSLSCVPREGLLPASFFQHLSVIGPPHYKKRLAIPCLTPPKPKKEKKLHKRTIISVTYCLSRAWKLACLPACLLPGAHLVTFFYHPTTAQRSPCRPQLVQFLLWKYKQDKKKCKWVPAWNTPLSHMVPWTVRHWRVCFQHPLAHHTTNPLPHTSQAQKEKRLHKRTIINVTYCLSRAWKLACLPACLLPDPPMFHLPSITKPYPCQPEPNKIMSWPCLFYLWKSRLVQFGIVFLNGMCHRGAKCSTYTCKLHEAKSGGEQM